MGRTIIVSEEVLERVQNENKPSKYAFNTNIRRFLNVLLSDPVHAEVPKCVSAIGVSKSRLLDMMKKIGLVEYSERLEDKNKDGSFKNKAVMKIKYKVLDKIPDEEEYRVPKNKFDEKVEKLRIMLFERNVPEGVNEDILDEDGGGATSCAITSGANTISMPLFGMMYQKPKTNKNRDYL
ncbi:MAG: hypothetical protein J6X18_07615 [Bacteroidales bacterium]|nr:hypothetical protein [Bacteroidales bacterium]